MSKQVKMRRGTATEHASFTGVVGEVTVDTTNHVLRVHDGATVGGKATARADGSNASGSWGITANAVATAVTFNNSGAGAASGTTFNGSTARTISYNTIGAAASGANTDITSLSPTAGLQVGAPTGGAKGAGTINAAGLFVNGVAVGTSSGTVSSVSGTGTVSGLTLTGTVTSTGSLTLGGTLAVTASNFASQTAKAFLAAPNAANGVPTFRAIVASDIPTLNQNTTGSSGSCTGNAATATSATTASSATTAASATTATTATTANALNTSNNYQVNSLGVGTAGSGTAGEIRATNNVTAYYSSDKRLKENIQPINNALGIVSAVGGKTFDWTDAYIAEHGGEDGYFVQKSDFGVIAQDLQAVFPLAVRTREDGTLAVDYEKLVAVAFAAIAELKAEVEALKKAV